MILSDKSVQNYIFRFPSLRKRIFDEKGNKVGSFGHFGMTTTLHDSDKSVLLKINYAIKEQIVDNLKSFIGKGKDGPPIARHTITDPSDNFLGTITIPLFESSSDC